jgi:acyl-CoA hydrolase
LRGTPRIGDREQTADAYVTFVTVGESGSPVAVPGSIVADDRCGRLRRDAFENAPAE